MASRINIAGLALFALMAGSPARAEDGAAAWLRDTPADRAAASELQRGLSSMLGRKFVIEPLDSSHSPGETEDAIILGSISNLNRLFTIDQNGAPLSGEQYRVKQVRSNGRTLLEVIGATPASEMYATFHLLEEVGADKPIPADDRQAPSAPIRWVDEWDNLDGSIERGYAGRSIFFDAGHVRQDLTRAGDYARLLASIGINGCNVNNVNADLDLLTSEHLRELARIADAFRPWGVKLALSVDLSSPQAVGGLDTFDPEDPTVIAWLLK